MSNAQLDKLIATYRSLAAIPALVSAQVLNEGSVVISTWSQRNLERGKVTRFLRNHAVTDGFRKVTNLLTVDVTTESLSSYSPSLSRRAVIREVDDKEGHRQYLEIWANHNLTRTIDLQAADLHGEIYTDVEFGSLEWSPDESKILYVAEMKFPKSEPFYKRKSKKQEGNKDGEEATKGEQYLFKQDWGEQLVNKKQSVLAVYDVSSDSISILEGVPADVCLAQSIWSPDGLYVVGVAFQTEPRKLGLIYCSNRLSAIFTLDFNKNFDVISTENVSVKSPRFSLDKKTLIWLQRKAHGPHHSCMQLVKKNLPLDKSTASEIVIDVVQVEKEIAGGRKFYGLYNTAFVKQCWASERRVVFSTNQKNCVNTYVLDIDSGALVELEYEEGSQLVLTVVNDIILGNRRTFFTPDQLFIARLPAKGQENSIEVFNITESKRVEYFNNLTYKYLNLKHNSGESVDTFSAIYVGPKSASVREIPLIIWPHGGPHSSFTNNLTLESSLFCACGFAVLLINYRGSVGAGQATVEFLPGKVGQTDVADCVFATQQALEKCPWLDPNRLVLVGGSHGGFLVSHLSGQHPDMFKAVVARNPVIDIASMSIISDIPDWCYVECGSSYTQEGPIDNSVLLSMRKASPIQHVHKVKAPTLLQVGSKDLRVPASQATEYYHRLKANGIKVRMNLYDDNHPLGLVPNEMDNLINSVLWIQQHIG